MRMVFLLIAVAGLSVPAAAQNSSDGWEFQITPYIWLPTISGDLNYEPPPGGGGGPSIDLGPTDWLDLINGAFLINGEARKGRFAVLTDLVFLSLESDKDRIASASVGPGAIPVDLALNLKTKSDLDGLSWTLAAGYTMQQSESMSWELIGGVRYFSIDAATNWSLSAAITAPGGGVVLPAEGRISGGTDLWDGIVGVRGHFALGEGNWSIPFYFDAGTGSSDLTWQAMTGLTYRFGWGELMGVYRHLAYDEGSDGLMHNFEFSGPAIGARFRF
jgi:hypothetical protein